MRLKTKVTENEEEEGKTGRYDCLSSPTVHVPSCCHADGCIHSSLYTQPYMERDQQVTCVNTLTMYGH